ncbi:MAG TPA: hypothetical protein VJM33_18115 [Microthrixaceae bacterium]|nr:hypothetical protein [Microthrixaceae bacterium]
MRTTLTLTLIAVGAVLLGGCGDDVASRDEFVDSLVTWLEEDSGGSIPEGAGGDEAIAVLEDFAGCMYDEISDDSQLVKDLMDDPDAVAEERMENAEVCSKKFADQIAEIMFGSREEMEETMRELQEPTIPSGSQ